VKKGDTLIIEESMKMEFRQQAPCDGYVSAIFVKLGDEVHTGQMIAHIMTGEGAHANETADLSA
jgi:urea carboxylase